MKIPLPAQRASMGWYTGTARAPAPKIWRTRPKAVAPARDRAAAPRKRWRRIRRRRLLTNPGSSIGAVVMAAVLVGLGLFVIAWVAAMGTLDVHEIGLRLADTLRRAR